VSSDAGVSSTYINDVSKSKVILNAVQEISGVRVFRLLGG
jgi:hypothetical protein